MLNLLTNWRCILKIGIAGFIAILLTYSCHLSHKVDSLKEDNQILTESLKANIEYISRYEAQKAINDAETASFLNQAQSIKNDACIPPDSFKQLLSGLR